MNALWRELETYRSDLTATATGWGLSTHDAEDVASEAMLRTAVQPDMDLSRLRQAVFAALRRCLLDRVEWSAQEIRAVQRSWRADPTGDGPVEREVVGRQYVGTLIDRARLTGQEEQVVRLVVAGHRHTEVAGRLGVTAKASQRSLDRARSKLRKALAVEHAATA